MSGKPPIRPEALIFGAIALFVFGLLSTNLLLLTLKKVGLNEGLISAFALVCLTTLLSVEGTFLWLLVSRVLRRERGRQPEILRPYKTNELPPVSAQSLVDQVPSAVEQTTRNLEPSFVPRTSGDL